MCFDYILFCFWIIICWFAAGSVIIQVIPAPQQIVFFLFWQQFLWQMDNRPDIVLGGLNHWLLPAEFMRGVDCISPGACERKIEKASHTLRHIMNRNEVPVSEVEGCKRSEKRWQTAWNGKVIKKNLNKARIIFNHFTCVYFDVFTYTGVQFLLIDLLSDHEQLFFLFI